MQSPQSDLSATSTSCRMANSTANSSIETVFSQNLKIDTKPLPNNTLCPQKKAGLNWISAIAFVKFDIDQGNVVEAVYPSDLLSKAEQKTLSLLSFPDSNSFSAEGALKFVFRLKRDAQHTDCEFNALFGYVYFRQQRDPTNPRGFSQKSLVILSVLPFCTFFKNTLDIIGSQYFDLNPSTNSEQFLIDNYNTIINEWARPQPGIQHEVTIYGQKITVSIPKKIYESKHIEIQETSKTEDQKSFGSAGSPVKEIGAGSQSESDEEEHPKEQPLSPALKECDQSLSSVLSGFSVQEKGCFQDINLYKIFKGNKLPYLWKLWELVLTNQPIMVVSDLPSECSETVLGLLSTICPLEYQTEYKPYFTIYDPEYREIQDLYDKKIAKCAIIGVTNPLFLKTMENYPNIFHLEKDYLKSKKAKAAKKTSLLESLQKTYTLPDPNLKKMFMNVDTEEVDAINNALLKKSLQNLTESFLSIFQIYFKLQINDIKKFEEKDFMKFLELQKFTFKAQFSSQSHIIKLYTKFLKSSNFQRYIKSLKNVYIVKSL